MRATVARVLGGAGHVLRRAASPGETSPRCVRRVTRAGAWGDVRGAFEGVDETAVVAARCGGAAVPAGGTIACPRYVYHVHQEPS